MPTLNLQVSSGADDGDTGEGAFSNSDSDCWVGRTWSDWDSFFRFTGVSGLSGATINSADFIVRNFWEGPDHVRDFRIYADDSAAPTAPTDAASHSGKTRTTAYTDVTGPATPFWAEGVSYTFSVTSVIQELADSYDPSAIQILFDNDASANYGNVRWWAYDGDSASAAKLDIDYTAGGGGTAVPVFAHHYRRMKAA